ncbi:MAG: hypothetical protein WC456_00215 [Patescibacteria group bacterium]
MVHHLIFEGAELAGKSWVMSQIYHDLEPRAAASANVLDGCYWLNCDLGFFGTELAAPMVQNYLEIFRTLHGKNLLIEKFSLSAQVYSELYGAGSIDRPAIEKELGKSGFRTILLTFPEDQALIQDRLDDRLRLYPDYRRIAKAPEFYIRQQRLYLERAKDSFLDYLVLEVEKFPDERAVAQIKAWING